MMEANLYAGNGVQAREGNGIKTLRKVIFVQLISLLFIAISFRFLQTARNLTFPEIREKVLEAAI